MILECLLIFLYLKGNEHLKEQLVALGIGDREEDDNEDEEEEEEEEEEE